MNVYVALNVEGDAVSVVLANSQVDAEGYWSDNEILRAGVLEFTKDWFERQLVVSTKTVVVVIKDVPQAIDRTLSPSMIVYEGKMKVYAARNRGSTEIMSVVVADTREDAIEYWKGRGIKPEVVEEETQESFERWKKEIGTRVMPMYNAVENAKIDTKTVEKVSSTQIWHLN